MVSLNTTLIRIDQVCDIIPYVSSATNAVSLVFYSLVNSGCIPETVKDNCFANHLYNKNKLRSITLLVPFYGNGAIIIYSLFSHVTSKENVDIPIQPPVVNIKRSKTNEEKKIEYVNLFLDKIGPTYRQRFANAIEACAAYIIAIDFVENRDANIYGELIKNNLEKLLKLFVQEINYVSFNAILVMLEQPEKDKLLEDFLNTSEVLAQRQELMDRRKECIELTQTVLEIMSKKPNENLLNSIHEILGKLSDHSF
jgi:hypothetical protein